MEKRIEKIVLETARYQIVGELHLPREGYRSRLSDYLNRGDDDFLSIVNAEVSGEGATRRHEFLAVARSHVQLAYPAAESAG